MSDINAWSGRCKLWSDCDNLTWSELIIANDIFISIDSGKSSSGEGYINVPQKHIEKEVEKINKENKEKVITIIVKLKDYKKIKQKKKVKKVGVTVEDIQFLIKETKNVEVRILKD